MPVTVPLIDLVCLSGTRPLWPAEFRALIEQIETTPAERTPFAVAADWCDEHEEPGLAKALRYLHKRPEIEVNIKKESRYTFCSLSGIPYSLDRKAVDKDADTSTVAGLLADLWFKIEKAMEELS